MALIPVGSRGLLTLDGVDLVKFVPDLNTMQVATDTALGNVEAGAATAADLAEASAINAAATDATNKVNIAKAEAGDYADSRDQVIKGEAIEDAAAHSDAGDAAQEPRLPNISPDDAFRVQDRLGYVSFESSAAGANIGPTKFNHLPDGDESAFIIRDKHGYVALQVLADGTVVRDQRAGREAILQGWVRDSKGVIGTGGKPAIGIRFDHGPAAFRDKVAPVLKTHGIPSSMAVHVDMITDAQAGGMTWAQVEQELINAGTELWCHGRTHAAPTAATLESETAGAKAELETVMPRLKVQGWAMPGVEGSFMGWTPGDRTTIFSPGGQAIRDNFPMSESNNLSVYRTLPNGFQHGANTLGVDTTSLSTLQAYVDRVIALNSGAVFMLHPHYLDLPGNMTTATFTAFIEYVAAKRDAGLLEVLTPSGMQVANPDSTRRKSLIADHSTPWSSSTAGAVLARSSSSALTYGLSGESVEGVARLSGSGTVRLRVYDATTPANLDLSRTVALTGTAADYRVAALIPAVGFSGNLGISVELLTGNVTASHTQLHKN